MVGQNLGEFGNSLQRLTRQLFVASDITIEAGLFK